MKFPGVKILDRYIIKKFLGTFVFAIALLIVVILIFDTVEKMDKLLENKTPLSAFLFQYIINFIPYFINQFGGLFVFIAVIFFTSKLDPWLNAVADIRTYHSAQLDVYRVEHGESSQEVETAANYLDWLGYHQDTLLSAMMGELDVPDGFDEG